MDNIFLLCLIVLPAASTKDSYSLWVFMTSIEGQTPFPQLSWTLLLDDISIGYYDGDTHTFIARGNTTNEDSLIEPDAIMSVTDFIEKELALIQSLILTNGVRTFQRLISCELLNNGEPGEMIIWEAFLGSTIDTLRWYNGTLEFSSQIPQLMFNPKDNLWLFKNVYYPLCKKTLESCLEKRKNQVDRKVKPTVSFFQKPGGSQVNCLATGFYPRHINLTLFRDGQPVDDHEVTTGDLLPNDDGTYQMRKILEISEEEQREKHKYTCTATHVSLDVILEYDNRTPLKLVAILIPTVLSFVLISVIVAAIIQVKKRHAVTVAPAVVWSRKHGATVEHVNSMSSGHSNDSMIKD